MIDIIHHPHDLLRQVAHEVVDFDGLDESIERMLEVMYAEHGVGLAAPQVSDLRRIVLVDPSGGENAASLRVMINPVIEFASPDKDVASEGCLSLPGINVQVARSKLISVKYVSANNTPAHALLNGQSARIAQHEIDHINGITLLDYVKNQRRYK